MTIKISQEQLDGILSEVEESIAPVLKSEAAKLKKAAEESSGGGSPSASASPEASGGGEGSGGSPSAPPAGPDASASAPPAGGPPSPSPAAPSPSPAGPPAGPDASASAGAPPMDPAQLAQMIAQMPPEAVKAIYMAAKQQLFAAQGAGPSAPPAGPDAGAMPPSPSPAAPPSPSPAGPPAGGPPMDSPVPPMGKNEMKPSPGNGGKVTKSEDQKRIEELEKLVKSQAEAMKVQAEETALLTKAVSAIAKTPLRKSVTSVAASGLPPMDPEPKPMTKAELNQKLKDAIQSGKLAKKQRENITRFYDTGSVNLDLVKDVLTLKL